MSLGKLTIGAKEGKAREAGQGTTCLGGHKLSDVHYHGTSCTPMLCSLEKVQQNKTKQKRKKLYSAHGDSGVLSVLEAMSEVRCYAAHLTRMDAAVVSAPLLCVCV